MTTKAGTLFLCVLRAFAVKSELGCGMTPALGRLSGWIVLAACLLLAGLSFGDTLELTGGDRLTGTIESVSTDKVVLATAYAGKLSIDRHAVLRIGTDKPVHVALADGGRVAGVLATSSAGAVTIATTTGRVSVACATNVIAVWRPGAPDPTLPPRAAWKYSLALDLLGRSGNSQSFQFGGEADAVRSGPTSDLKFYAKGDYSRAEGSISDNRMLGGVDFEQRFAKASSWYLRDEIQRDEVLGICVRNVLAGGYGYYLQKSDTRELRLRLGLGQTFTKYSDPLLANESNVSIDTGLHFLQKFGAHAVWTTDITYQPTVSDFANYYVTHESKLSIPLKIPNLSQEFGVGNQYESDASADKKRMDTTYFMRTRLTW